MLCIQAWQVAHPPKRGLLCNLTRPMVHRGFLSSWRSKGFNTRILDHVRGLIAARGVDARSMRCLVTGSGCQGLCHRVYERSVLSTAEELRRLHS